MPFGSHLIRIVAWIRWLGTALLAGDRSLRVDGLIVLSYLGGIMVLGLSSLGSAEGGVTAANETAAGYFLAGRTLAWPSIAMSVIATNIDAGQFIGYAGGAYSYGLAQAQFEWSAVVRAHSNTHRILDSHPRQGLSVRCR